MKSIQNLAAHRVPSAAIYPRDISLSISPKFDIQHGWMSLSPFAVNLFLFEVELLLLFDWFDIALKVFPTGWLLAPVP